MSTRDRLVEQSCLLAELQRIAAEKRAKRGG